MGLIAQYVDLQFVEVDNPRMPISACSLTS